MHGSMYTLYVTVCVYLLLQDGPKASRRETNDWRMCIGFWLKNKRGDYDNHTYIRVDSPNMARGAIWRALIFSTFPCYWKLWAFATHGPASELWHLQWVSISIWVRVIWSASPSQRHAARTHCRDMTQWNSVLGSRDTGDDHLFVIPRLFIHFWKAQVD